MTRLMNVHELASYLSIKPKTLYEMARKNEIPHFKAGRLVRFSIENIDAWLERKSVEVVEKKKPEPKTRKVTRRDPWVDKLIQEVLARKARSSKQ